MTQDTNTQQDPMAAWLQAQTAIKNRLSIDNEGTGGIVVKVVQANGGPDEYLTFPASKSAQLHEYIDADPKAPATDALAQAVLAALPQADYDGMTGTLTFETASRWYAIGDIDDTGWLNCNIMDTEGHMLANVVAEGMARSWRTQVANIMAALGLRAE